MAKQTSKVAPKTVTKKTVSKPQTAPVKKVAPKKVIAKKAVAAKPLVYADNDHSFWVSDGQIFNSLQALHDGLATMEKATYAHHVTKSRHDFAEWVSVVLGDTACAADLKKAKAAAGAKLALAKHLKNYQQ